MSDTTSALRRVTLPTPGTPRHLPRLRYFSTPADAGTTGAPAGEQGSEGEAGGDPKPTETVEFWKAKARDQEKRAKDNAAAAKRLAELEDAQKTDTQKSADAVATANARAETAEARVAALTIATEHKLGADDAALLAELQTEDAMRALAKRLADVAEAQSKKPPRDPKLGGDTTPPKADENREFARKLFGRTDSRDVIMTVLTTGDLVLPTHTLDPWLKSVANGSAVAALSGQTPQKFGKGQAMVFDAGEAEYVGEGANKGASTVTKTTQTVDPFKFHKTVRWTEEVMWADEDDQLGVVDQILALIQPALSRALDFGVFHGINPTGGTAVAAMTQKLDSASNVVTTGAGTPLADLDEAVTLVLQDGVTPNGIALDPQYAAQFVTARNATTDAKTFPDFRPTTAVSNLDGWAASTSRTVNATGVMSPPPGVGAYLGDFSAIRWGIQRAIGLEVIQYGDPDGGGDLKRNNQVAFRAEVVYGWGIGDLDAFAKIMVGTDDDSSSSS